MLNAVKFKLVLRMFAVIKRGTPYVELDTYKNLQGKKQAKVTNAPS